MLTERIFSNSSSPSAAYEPSPLSPDSENRPLFSPVPSLQDIHHPSPTSSSSSVEFIEEIPFISPPPGHYFFGYHDDFYSLISELPPVTDLLPPGTFTLGPEGLDLEDLKTTISGLGSNVEIPVFFPDNLYPYSVPVQLFYNIFPPSAVLEGLPLPQSHASEHTLTLHPNKCNTRESNTNTHTCTLISLNIYWVWE